ncbi:MULTISPECIES: TrmH family RNA methyltransferase [Holospora]|uniref:23S rRNA (Guanosine-2'-O-)-methyltransferase RlmB n=2 Tax=Holospora TaxID=44747 RepID=A0A061JGW4_9PROT|nr:MULTISPECIES: RNA methyltransferase [Holospora]ETZ05340.1 23S rRNA (guanosine-2'-O-)-methyltransferase RlmB [Holospora undulata HU1]GAJ46689.1 23S rRNA (guanosine-2'-O-)-methyltransferase RlmB [Holospora elegans E1]
MKVEKEKKLKREKIWIWGIHSVEAALCSGRSVYELLYISSKSERFGRFGGRQCKGGDIDQIVPKGAVHQGVALLTDPSPSLSLEDLDPKKGTVLVLDQVVDPHNVGALWRSAAAFQAQAILFLTQRSANPEKGSSKNSNLDGVITKAASGATEKVPYVLVVNLGRALETLKSKGFFCVGLCETGKILDPKPAFQDLSLALIVGQEGKGLRFLTRQYCDILWKLRVCPDFPTLNVSVAAAVALSELYALKK